MTTVSRFSKAPSLLALTALGVAASSAFAAPFPTTSAVPEFTHPDVAALIDFDDLQSPGKTTFVNSGTAKVAIFENVTAIHILPHTAELALDADTGDADFAVMPSFDLAGRVSGLTLDFSLRTRVTESVKSELRTSFPKATFYYPTAASSRFTLSSTHSDIRIITLTGGNSNEPADVMNAVGMSEPIRMELTSKGLNVVRCGLEILENMERKAATENKPRSPELNVLALMTGSVAQTYKAVDHSALIVNSSDVKISTATNKVAIRLRADANAVTDKKLDRLIAQSIKDHKPECSFNSTANAVSELATLPGYAGLQREASTLGGNVIDYLSINLRLSSNTRLSGNPRQFSDPRQFSNTN